MHKVTSVQQAWVPVEVMVPGMGPSSLPQEVLRSAADELRGYWNPSMQEPQLSPAEGSPPLPRLTVAGLRRASSTFPKRTAATVDGFHPRHFSMLSDEALDTMLLIIDAMEEASRVPEQASWLVMCLIPKGPGKAGYRPIVLFSGLWRVWARSRSFMAKDLLRRMDQPFIACGAGRGTEEVVWRQATSAEAATTEWGGCLSAG